MQYSTQRLFSKILKKLSIPLKKDFAQKNNDFLTKMVKTYFFSQILAFFVSIVLTGCFEKKLAMLKIRSTNFTFLSLRNLEAAPEEAMQLRRLIKGSN